VPANKDRIGEALGEFVQSNFLSADVLGRKLAELKAGEKLTGWLLSDERSRVFAERLVGIAPDIFAAADDRDLRRFLISNLNALRQEIRIASALSTGLRALIEGDKHQQLLDEGLRVAEQLLDRHQLFLREALRQELPWYVPNFIHDKVYQDVVKRIRQTLHAINRDAHHPARHAFSAYLWRLIDELKTSPELEVRCQRGLNWIFESPLLSEYAEAVWSQLRSIAVKKLGEDRESATMLVQRGLQTLGKTLSEDNRLREKINQAAVTAGQRFAAEYQLQIAGFITETVRSWDSATVVSKIEEQVGKDLQYIRINGTLVGGLVGVLIHAVTLVLP
jgi:uncharacterized membrane-anchored protein YjiN (DUF445 family)